MSHQQSPAHILLFGTSGQVGHELQGALGSIGEVVGLDRAVADFSHPESLADHVRRHRPALVVIAAAHTAVDRVESESELAQSVNAHAPEVIAKAAREVGAAVIHFSTDYVYDGAKPSPYSESDATGPLSVYGRTKLHGDLAVAAANPRHLIFRTSWVVSARGSNFLKTMLRLAAERDALRVVADQRGAPTTARLIAGVAVRVAEVMLRAPDADSRWGVYHVVAAGETTWHGVASYIIGRARELGMSLKATPSTIAAITTSEYPTPARRPLNSQMDTAKLRAAFEIALPEWESGIDEILEELVAAAR
jgi:dTDP-4-dehydrorhamnose reductase